ncbi:Probable 18S rRNA (guanine-N(7))-methyltransferase [Seminavis robusta]|uniref:Probable 18S rRNA (Guanine-N(7))-methyltransferase n=1 Tax=Seminavis robusta TaxID=568900 RepID=A0A9N8H1D2_9STRA|nr:Probable 18S rRNA (guanine-N(7))-methyltransferase [Seminavis robusta]|eukprot:Sro2_g001730.1 Probable 18S rRNA (guanine-N(7))-methyltransferase (320) ;mRNA; r:234523-235558
MTSRPELTGHASLFYNQKEARKYHSSSRMIGVQREITERAMELLRLDPNTPALILDVGCGSGLSGQILEENGHVWLGCDVSRDMLTVANNTAKQQSQQPPKEESMQQDDSDDEEEEEEEEGASTGDLMHHDMGTGLPFRPATFDACISISALQWLCYSNSKNQNPKKRLLRFFSSLYTVLKRGGRAVLQFYPETADQAVLISETATKVGFAGGVVVDYPNSAKAKKHYLVLSFDRSSTQQQQQQQRPLTTGMHEQQQQQHVTVGSTMEGANNKKKKAPKKKKGVKTKEWIVHKKAMQRKKGKDVRPDTKYTARRRPHKF